MKIRIKFTKTGPLKFVGHLDIMRYFQKAFRRAKVDIAYSKGYSPHQLLSFAAPLGIGLTSEGEYLDAEFNSVESSQKMIDKINAVMVPDIQILEFHLLEDGAGNAMSSVAGADYLLSLRPGYYEDVEFLSKVDEFMKQNSIVIMKKTKKSEKEVDIRPMIYQMEPRGEQLFLCLCTGSAANLKPETVMEAYCVFAGFPYEKMAFMIHRLETYLSTRQNDPTALKPLSAAGHPIL